jgi:hypothetical protein
MAVEQVVLTPSQRWDPVGNFSIPRLFEAFPYFFVRKHDKVVDRRLYLSSHSCYNKVELKIHGKEF